MTNPRDSHAGFAAVGPADPRRPRLASLTPPPFGASLRQRLADDDLKAQVPSSDSAGRWRAPSDAKAKIILSTPGGMIELNQSEVIISGKKVRIITNSLEIESGQKNEDCVKTARGIVFGE